tara:strand:- start:27706 stop:27825 length:120 start_codon:yes stop_codon:yes gene_type:complete
MKKFIKFVKSLLTITNENKVLLENIKKLEEKEILNSKNY